MTFLKPKVHSMCEAMSTASEKPKAEVPWNWRTEVLSQLNVNLVKSIREKADAEFMDAINRDMIDEAVDAGDHTAVVLCRLVHKEYQSSKKSETIVVLASNVAEAMQVAGQHQKSQWPLERVDFLSPQQQAEWLPAAISEPVLRYYAAKLGLTVSSDEPKAVSVPDDAIGTSPIPKGFYYSPKSETFHYYQDDIPPAISFWERWQCRRSEFPGKWDVYSGSQLLGTAAAKTESEAIDVVLQQMGLQTRSQHGPKTTLRAERR